MSAPRPSRPGRALRVTATSLPRAITALRRRPPAESPSLLGLVVLSVLLVVGRLRLGFEVVPTSAQVLPLLGGGLLLRRRAMRLLIAVVTLAVVFDLVQAGARVVRPGSLVGVVVTAVLAYEFSRSREETGLSAGSGDTFVVELRNRLERQGELPPLPSGWSAEAVLRPAGGGPFAGDFVVSSLTDRGRRLELTLV